ncbi:MAG: hypothetical protein HZA28_01845 [Candidatus Omnitrophica bacterium]|nr:hypothetical protein [Candidatus Omnitrophota bacterium]
MIKVREIEKAALGLPAKDWATFRAWFHKIDDARWDRKLERDVQTGKLDHLAQKAVADFRKGRCKEL